MEIPKYHIKMSHPLFRNNPLSLRDLPDASLPHADIVLVL